MNCAHSLRVFTTVDRAGPRRESMMRTHGLKHRNNSQHLCCPTGAARPPRAPTHCLQGFGLVTEAEASGPTASSASIPSSLTSSWRHRGSEGDHGCTDYFLWVGGWVGGGGGYLTGALVVGEGVVVSFG